MCEVKLNDRPEFDSTPFQLSGVPDRSITPTNDSSRMEEICEFSFDLDELLDEIDMTSETSTEKDLRDTRNLLEEYISELSEDLLGEEKNSLSLCSSFVSSIDGEASSCFEGSYNALSFVEQCSQEIMGMRLNPVDIEMDNQETLPLSSPGRNSCSSPSLLLPDEQINIPHAVVSTLGRDITRSPPAKPPDPTASKLKANLSSLECFQSHAYTDLQKRYFNFSTLSPDDVIRLGRETAH